MTAKNEVPVSLVEVSKTDANDLKAFLLSIAKGDRDFTQLVGLLSPEIHSAAALDNQSALSFALSLGDIEQQANLNDQLHLLESDNGAPALAIAQNGQLLSSNCAAISLFGDFVGQNITSLGIRQSDFADFKNRIVSHDAASILRVFPDREHNEALIFIGWYQVEHHFFLLRAIEVRFPESISIALQEVFKLTTAECDVLACLGRGMQSDQISEYRQSKIGTVRQQIKSLLQKLGATSQVQIAAMASALASQSQSESNHAFKSRDKLAKFAAPSLPIYQSRQAEHVREARLIGWRLYGQKGGIPVLHMHSTYFGAGDHESEKAFANAAGLEVLIVERPGYGRTQPPNGNESSLDAHIKDCIAVMKELGWQSAWIVGHDYGFVFALALANQYPEKVKSILAISPLPFFKSNTDLSKIPLTQKAYFWAASHSFWMIRLMINLCLVRARKLGSTNWMEMVFEGSPRELAAFKTLQGKEISEASYDFGMRQTRGYELDLQSGVATDWSALLRKAEVPMVALTGKENTTFSSSAVQETLAVNPNVKLTVIEDAGHTLSITHADRVHKALLQLINKG